MGSGEWGMGNGEWGVGSGEWGMGSGEWGVGNGEWGWELLVLLPNNHQLSTYNNLSPYSPLPTPYSPLPTPYSPLPFELFWDVALINL
ncbi:MAG: hypothetical protein DSM106950_01205 [Stigonema ocellatum SAG 48.90 = DSM 106950]|nr:hypothetical protein [Stigonema ocellatum SAG 48.90 = DSM 106950]